MPKRIHYSTHSMRPMRTILLVRSSVGVDYPYPVFDSSGLHLCSVYSKFSFVPQVNGLVIVRRFPAAVKDAPCTSQDRESDQFWMANVMTYDGAANRPSNSE